MTTTDFGALTDAQRRVWAAELWQAGRDESFWFSNGFIGKSDMDMSRPICRVTKLSETERGLECVMQLVQDMVGDGVVGDNRLTDNEEQLFNDTQTIRIDMMRNAVRSKGEMAEQATVIRFRAQAKNKLTFWLSNRIDELMFLTASGRAYTLNYDGSTRTASQLPNLKFAADVAAASTNRLMFAGSATSEGTLSASNVMSWSLIIAARQRAKRKRITPLREGGKDYYVMVMSSEQARDLLLDPTYLTIVSRAAERGIKNPLFNNAIAVVGGVVLYEHTKVFSTLGLTTSNKWGSGGTVDGAQALLLGSGCLGLATIGNVFMREADVNDFGNRPALGIGRKLGMLKPQFKSIYDSNGREDFGLISVKTAAAA